MVVEMTDFMRAMLKGSGMIVYKVMKLYNKLYKDVRIYRDCFEFRLLKNISILK